MPQYNQDTGQWEETDEEKRQREETAATPVQKQESTTYGDGSQEHKTTINVPANIGPVSPTNYNAYIGQQESSNNPNIGYHYPVNQEGQRQSSAYGTYGITGAAYKDVQAANPKYANRDITSLTPAEQTEVNNTYKGVLATQLQNQGIEPSESNIRGAHFLGAKGLSDYLTNGTISPQAAAANGGIQNVQNIVQNRMGGQPSPSSQPSITGPVSPTSLQNQANIAPPGEASYTPTQNLYNAAGTTGGMGLQMPNQQPQIAPGFPASTQVGIPSTNESVNTYQANQDNPLELLKIRNDDSHPEWIRERAGNRASELLNQEVKQKEATQQVQDLAMAAAQGDPKASRQIANELSSKEGSWAKMILLGFISPQLAGEEAVKLGFGNKWQPAMDANGKAGLIEYNAKGLPLRGTLENGKPMTPEELTAYASQGVGKATDLSMTLHQAPVNGELHTFESKRTASGMIYRDSTANGQWSRQAPASMTTMGQQDPGHIKGLTAANSIVTKMSKANQDAIAATGRPLYSQDQIIQARNESYSSIAGKPFGGGALPVPSTEGATTAPTAPAAFPRIAPGAPTTAPTTSPTTAPTTAPIGPKSIAQQILDYDTPAPTGPTTPTKIAIMNEVNRLASEQGKTYDGSQYKIAAKTRQDFTTGKQGQAVQSMNVAVDHLDTLDKAAKELNNGNIPLFNSIAQQYAKNTGQSAPTNFDALKSIVGSEVAKAVSGGASALGDREEIRREIDKANSPQQLAEVIKKYQQLMAGQVKGLKQTYESAGLKDFDKKLLPRTIQVLNSVQEPTRSKW